MSDTDDAGTYDPLAFIDEAAAKITPADVRKRLDATLRKVGYEPSDPLINPVLLSAYQAVLAAIADGFNRKAAGLLRDLTPANLNELHVICGDVQVMVEAEQRRRSDPEGSG